MTREIAISFDALTLPVCPVHRFTRHTELVHRIRRSKQRFHRVRSTRAGKTQLLLRDGEMPMKYTCFDAYALPAAQAS